MSLNTVDKMFLATPLNPPDSIFGLIEEFKKDPRKDKVNLSVGVYQDESGTTPLMKCVRDAESVLAQQAGSKNYLPIDGIPSYNSLIGNLILGDELCPVEASPVRSTSIHSVTAQTPGGTAALRIAGDLLKRVYRVGSLWISDPTWANHQQIFEMAGLNLKVYGYLDDKGTGLDFEKVLAALETARANDAVLLHTVCHNPTGVDFGPEQWRTINQLLRDKSLLPIFDFAYQGFGTGIEPDATPIRDYCRDGGEGFICNSFSKNFGLYGERVGGITAVASSASSAAAVLSQIKLQIRTIYSNPPLHGGAIVSTVLSDRQMRSDWAVELAAMRERIEQLRSRFVEIVNRITPAQDFEYVNHQRGMFSYSGLNPEQVERLKHEYGIYALTTGRINIAGLNGSNIERVCEAIAEVVARP
jgi:aspartate/tyrosine/aromatic aminotransferase